VSWYSYYHVKDNTRLTPTITLLELELLKNALAPADAGQFVMVYLPSVGEVPLSVYFQTKNTLKFIVEDFGGVSSEMVRLKRGVRVGVRGPYGKGFTKKANTKYLLVAGGSGAPPLLNFLRQVSLLPETECVYLLGAKSVNELFLLDEPLESGARVFVSTDDGTRGFKGFVTQLARSILEREKFDALYACGPEQMLLECFRIARQFGVTYEGSFVRDVRCAVGACTLCVFEKTGKLLCTDGPVFREVPEGE
jgi:2-polyprenylphenol hydroxylase and related flavodoxin oxidoreductases